jgi:hypothetical protein
MTDDNPFNIKVEMDEKDPTMIHITASLPPNMVEYAIEQEWLEVCKLRVIANGVPEDQAMEVSKNILCSNQEAVAALDAQIFADLDAYYDGEFVAYCDGEGIARKLLTIEPVEKK